MIMNFGHFFDRHFFNNRVETSIQSLCSKISKLKIKLKGTFQFLLDEMESAKRRVDALRNHLVPSETFDQDLKRENTSAENVLKEFVLHPRGKNNSSTINVGDLKAWVGKEIGTSHWLGTTLDINHFPLTKYSRDNSR